MNNDIIWKTLKYQSVEYENYEINNHGDLRHKKNKKILKRCNEVPTESHKVSYVYCNICLGKHGSSKRIILHRAVAETFLENENEYSFVLFKDGNLNNVCSSNLYWSKTKSTTMSDVERKEHRRKMSILHVSNRRRKIKEMSIEYKGGKCFICGYDKCNGALEFHHLNPSEKDFAISRKGVTRSWDRVKEELDKCICVCANCHREIHNGLIDLTIYNIT